MTIERTHLGGCATILRAPARATFAPETMLATVVPLIRLVQVLGNEGGLRISHLDAVSGALREGGSELCRGTSDPTLLTMTGEIAVSVSCVSTRARECEISSLYG